MLMNRDGKTIADLEAVGRTRILTEAESMMLERAVRRAMREDGRQTRPWLPKHDLALARAVRARKRVRDIAKLLDRTELAVWRRLAKLRKDGKVAYYSQEGGRGRYRREMAQ